MNSSVDRAGHAWIACDGCSTAAGGKFVSFHKTRVMAAREGWKVADYHDRTDRCPACPEPVGEPERAVQMAFDLGGAA